MRAVGIVQARGGSKRLPNKNIRLLDGKPMVLYSCEAATSSGVLEAVYVNTDSPEIALVARRAGVECPALRPAQLATDDASSEDANRWLLGFLAERGERFDALAVLQATSPLRTAQDIRDAMSVFEDNAPCALKSVCPTKPARWHGLLGRGGVWEPIAGDETLFRLNGAIYIHTYGDYMDGRAPRKTVAFPMPAGRSVDVDTLDDFRHAEFLMSHQQAIAV